MFSIIISEKGGAERKETFDKGEINVGRVQGNDLMLPKGNVSKHHARLLYRDGRFIVSDLKSTNGTYVNGRKIAQATIVREGDKIYIGDFVLRLDGAAAGAAPGLSAPLPAEGERANGASSGVSSALQGAASDGAGAPPRPALGSSPMRGEGPGAPQRPVGAARPASAGHGQTMPLNVSRAQAASPSGASPRAETVHGSPPFVPAMPAPVAPEPPVAVVAPPRPEPAPRAEPQAAPVAPSIATAHAYPAALRPSPRAEPPAAAPRGGSSPLAALVARIVRAVDLPAEGPPTSVDAALSNAINAASQAQLAAFRESPGLPAGVDGEELARSAWRELAGLGPLERLLGDAEVTAVHFPRHDLGFVVRAGTSLRVDTVFTSDEALARTVLRLAERAGVPRRSGELVVERRLAEGFDLVAIAPPLSPVHGLVLRRHASIAPSLDEWSRDGVLTRPMASLLEACVRGRARLLVCGPHALASDFVAALAACVGPEDEVVLVGAGVTAGARPPPSRAIQIDPTGIAPEDAFAAALRLRPDLLVVEAAKGGMPFAAILEQGVSGGLLVGAPGDTLRRALEQGALSLAVSRPGLSLAAAREVLGSAFDLAIELSETAERRPRVTRIRELARSDGSAPQDVFTYSPDTGFASHGVVPAVVEDLARRGFLIDDAIFNGRSE